MPLLEALTIDVGASIAKSILKIWLKSDIASDASASIVDVLKSRTTDRLAQQRARQQFEKIGEKVGESLLPLFEIDGARLDEGSCTAVAMAVAETLNTATSDVLAQQNLEPANLAKHLLNAHPGKSYHFSDTEIFLYERIISESCEYVVDIASQLPNFTEYTIAEVLKREGQLLDITEKILQEVRRMREQLNPQAEAARFELEYRRTVVRHLDILQLFGADVAMASKRHRLSVAYVTLSVEQRSQSVFHDECIVPDEAMTNKTRTQDEVGRRVVSVDEALANSQYLLIRGLAGSGKTTLLQWVAVNSASQTFKGPLTNWNTTIPFYIRLRQCIQAGLPAPDTFPTLITTAIADAMPKGWVRTQLDEGRAVVLVDGLDEVPERQREDVRLWLQDLIATYPKARFIVTSRPHAVEEGWLDADGFKDAALQGMELPDIYAFIEHWHEAVAEQLQDKEEKAQLPTFAAQLKEEVLRNRAKRSLTTSPLLCAMLCALNRERHQQLPSDRIELYKACCELLIERRDLARGILLSDYPALALTYRQKRVLLEDLAYWLIRNGWSEVALEQADERFRWKLSNMQGIPQNCSGIAARRLFVERSGIVREPVMGQLDFTHRTFQEFLAAQAALDEGDLGMLVQNAHNDQWREVVLLAAGLASKKLREELIQQLIGRADTEKAYRSQLYLLAVSCLQSSIEDLGQNVKIAVEKRLGALIPPKNIGEAEALAAAGELAVPYLLAQEGYSEETAAVCVRALSRIDGDIAFSAIEGYARDTRPKVVYELFRGWNSFEDKEMYARRILLNFKETPELDCFVSLDGFQYLTNLNSLFLKDSSQIKDLSPLASLRQLTRLILVNCEQVSDLSPLASLRQLTTLRLNCEQVSDLSPLASLRQLTRLTLEGCTQVSDLSPLASLRQLTTLSLFHCRQLSDLSPLASLRQLTRLNLWFCEQVSDLSPLASLRQLTRLNLDYSKQVKDLKPLVGLSNLKELSLQGLSRWISIPQSLKGRVKIIR